MSACPCWSTSHDKGLCKLSECWCTFGFWFSLAFGSFCEGRGTILTPSFRTRLLWTTVENKSLFRIMPQRYKDKKEIKLKSIFTVTIWTGLVSLGKENEWLGVLEWEKIFGDYWKWECQILYCNKIAFPYGLSFFAFCLPLSLCFQRTRHTWIAMYWSEFFVLSAIQHFKNNVPSKI